MLHSRFVLEDETVSLPVVVLGNCNQSVVEALPKDGNRVQVAGILRVLKSETLGDVIVQATVRQILESD